MRIGVDGSSLREEGGLTHIVEILRAAEPQAHGVSRVILWGGAKTLERIEDRPWLEKVHESILDRSIPVRRLWQRFRLKELGGQEGCDLLFCPGGPYCGAFRPFVTMVPLEWSEAGRLGMPRGFFKLIMDGRAQASSFEAASGVIYPSEYAARTIGARIGPRKPYAVIPWGISGDFPPAPRAQRRIGDCSGADPFRILSVSSRTAKDQWRVADAVARLRREGIPAAIDMVGPACRPCGKRLKRVLAQADPAGMFIRCLGEVAHCRLSSLYRQAELFVYASSRESTPGGLLEAMARGLPIVCSNRGPMPEMLGDAGLYFDPESAEQLAGAMRKLILDRARRRECSALARRYAGSFSWERRAHDLFAFLCQVRNQGWGDDAPWKED